MVNRYWTSAGRRPSIAAGRQQPELPRSPGVRAGGYSSVGGGSSLVSGTTVADWQLMALSADEREILSDLIGSVRTLAAHVMTLHLQLGAVRRLLARKGTISDAELQAAFAELNVVASAEEVLNLTSTDAVFDELLERLNRAA
jgi:hypothetical protein